MAAEESTEQGGRMSDYRKVYDQQTNQYLGLVFYDGVRGCWIAENREARARGFNAESWAEAWLMRQVERAEAA